MSKFKKVFIRTIKSIEDKNDPLLYELFTQQQHNINKPIPIVYQYSQTYPIVKKPSESPEDIIGEVTSIYNDGTRIYCDATIYDQLSKAIHFNNVIDNYTIMVKNNKDDKMYKLVRFVIYDKEFKRKVDDEICAKKIKNRQTELTTMSAIEIMRQAHYNRT